MFQVSSSGFRVFGVSLALTLLASLAGCASKPEIVPSQGPRTATSASAVKMYQKQPKKYELLGTVTVTNAEGAKWDNKGDANAAFDSAKAKAAAMGANGLLMMANPGESDFRVTAGYHGTFYQVPARGPKGEVVGVMQAIYMLEE